MEYEGVVLVTGATGVLGQRIVRALSQQGVAVRALVDAPELGEVVEQPGVTISVGETFLPSDVRRAVTGVRAIISTDSGKSLTRKGATTMRVEHDGNLLLIDAAVQAGVEHFVLLTTLGAGWLRTSARFEAQRKAEQYLRASSLRYTVLRAASLMLDASRLRELAQRWKVLPVVNSAHPLPVISPDDLAALAACALWTPDAYNHTFSVANEESHWTAANLRDLFNRALGRSARVLPLPTFALGLARRLAHPFLPGVADRVAQMEANVTYSASSDAARLQEIFGMRFTGYEEYLRGS